MNKHKTSGANITVGYDGVSLELGG